MLTDTEVRKAKPKAKPYKLSDGQGLWLLVTAAGAKHWRWRYAWQRSETMLSLGTYPAVSIVEARRARDDAKALLRSGVNPSTARRVNKLTNQHQNEATFKAIALEWHGLQKDGWTPIHASDVIGSLEKYVFPILGDVPVRDITAPMVLALLRTIEARPAVETAHRVRQRMSAVFVFAISSGRGENDPAAVVKQAMRPIKRGRQPAVIDLDDAREMLSAAEKTFAHPVTKLAHRLLALTGVRPGTLIKTPWTELDGAQEQIWRIPAERMKLRLAQKEDEARDHLVPLPTQAIEIISAVKAITGNSKYVFPNSRTNLKPMSENAIGYLLNRAGYNGSHVPHGWRSTFSTVMNEKFPSDRAVIDLMLAHLPKEKVERAYNRAEHMKRRKELAQAWADLILKDALPLSEIIDGRRR